MKKMPYFSISYTFLDGLVLSLLSYRKKLSVKDPEETATKEFEGGRKEGEAQ